ncbi:MAG: hypothetical protein Q9162_007041 [Coniocarpon cinnabarinum]
MSEGLKVVFKHTKQYVSPLYYPTNPSEQSTHPRHPWVPKPMSLYAEGYARFARMSNYVIASMFQFGLWMLTGSTEIAALVDVPLFSSDSSGYRDDPHDGPQEPTDGPKSRSGFTRTNEPIHVVRSGAGAANRKFPVVVFSHGMASSRTSYSHYCGSLASRGVIVAAIEHLDGSGPASVVNSASGAKRIVYPIVPSDLRFDVPRDTNEATAGSASGTSATTDAGAKVSMEAFKEEQLSMRLAEVGATIQILHGLNKGDGSDLQTSNFLNEGTHLATFSNRLDLSNITMAGHSFGATLALRALHPSRFPTLPFSAGIALDPGKSSGPLNGDIKVPLLIVHSQSWSATHTIFHGRPHFEVVREIAEKLNRSRGNSWFMTSRGTTHPSVTDAPLIEPGLLNWTTGSSVDVKEGVERYVDVSEELLELAGSEKKGEVLREEVMDREFDGKRVVKGVEDRLEEAWCVHVAPQN